MASRVITADFFPMEDIHTPEGESRGIMDIFTLEDITVAITRDNHVIIVLSHDKK